MIKVLVVADDLTGSNDTGALLSKAGFDTVASVTSGMSEEIFRDRTALCLNADTRSLPEADAKRIVSKAVSDYYRPGMLLCKRIDSTLRGNVGAEIDAVLSVLPAGTKAVVVPAFPRAGRVLIGGELLVNGVPLTESDAGRDVKTPVRSSRAKDIIRLQSGRPSEEIMLSEIRGGADQLAERFAGSAADILIADAENDGDIDRIAAACAAAGLDAVCFDPGSFSVAMARARFPEVGRKNKNLLVVGSLCSATRAQLSYFRRMRDPLYCEIRTEELMADFEKEQTRVFAEVMAQADAFRDICLVTDEKVYSKGDSAVTDSDRIADRFTDIAAGLLTILKDRIACVYLSGGDIAKGFLSKMDLEALNIIDEVIPLAVYSKTISRSGGTVALLTKGGMIGGETAICDMIRYAEER